MKGAYLEECNRGACPNKVATWYNKSTRAFYCGICARLIMQYPENVGLLVNMVMREGEAG